MQDLSPNFYSYLIENKGSLFFVTNCIRVIDGDTIVIDSIPIPFIEKGSLSKVSIRLKDINCIDTTAKSTSEEKEKALQASKILESLILNKEIVIEINPHDFFGSFKRVLAYVYINNININKYLLDNGYVKLYS